MEARISMSAIMNWMAWLRPIGWPNASSLARVLDRLVDAALRQPGRQRGDRDPALVEDPRGTARSRGLARRGGSAAGDADVHERQLARV